MNVKVKTNKTNSVTNKKQKGVSNAMKSWRQLKKHKMAVTAGIILIIIYFFVIFAGIISPYSPYETYKKHFYHPPTKVHFTDEDGISWPYVYETEEVGWAKYEEIKDQKYPIKLFHRGPEYKFWGLFKTNIHLLGVEEPAHLFLMGTDNFGRDIFSRILFGGRISMFIGIVGILITTIFGVTIGSISGYYGGFIDSVLMRLAEIILSIPQFYLLLALAAVMPIDMTSTMRFLLIIIILAFISWAGMSRVIRGMVLSIKNEDYVKAAKALGATDLRIIFKHVIPSTATYVIINATLAVPGYILMESGLSFLGLGIQEPDPSWGNMLTAAQKVTKITNYPWVLIPGLMIFIGVLFYNILGDGVRDALDPKSNKN